MKEVRSSVKITQILYIFLWINLSVAKMGFTTSNKMSQYLTDVIFSYDLSEELISHS